MSLPELITALTLQINGAFISLTLNSLFLTTYVTLWHRLSPPECIFEAWTEATFVPRPAHIPGAHTTMRTETRGTCLHNRGKTHRRGPTLAPAPAHGAERTDTRETRSISGDRIHGREPTPSPSPTHRHGQTFVPAPAHGMEKASLVETPRQEKQSSPNLPHSVIAENRNPEVCGTQTRWQTPTASCVSRTPKVFGALETWPLTSGSGGGPLCSKVAWPACGIVINES